MKILTAIELATLSIAMTNGVIVSASYEQTITPIITGGINMVFIGDSNTAGTKGPITTLRFPDLFQSLHSQDITISNQGVSGYTTTDLINTVSTTVYPKKVIGKRNIVSVLIGINDIYLGGTANGTWSNLQTLISNLKSNGWEVWVMTYTPATETLAKATAIKDLNILIRNNSSLGYTVLDVYNDFVDSNGATKPGLIQADIIHLTELGHRMIVGRLEKSLSYLLTYPDMFAIGIISPPSASVTYTTWNPSDKSANITLSGSNLIATCNGAASFNGVRSVINKSSGKWYWEYAITTWVSGVSVMSVGIGKSTATLLNYVGQDANGWGWYNDGTSSKIRNNATDLNSPTAFAQGDIIGIALDLTASTVAFYKNNTLIYTTGATVSGNLFAMVSCYNLASVTAKFGPTLTYTPPAGFSTGLYN